MRSGTNFPGTNWVNYSMRGLTGNFSQVHYSRAPTLYFTYTYTFSKSYADAEQYVSAS